MAQEFPHLTRAPITEAVLDIRVELPAGSSPEAITTGFKERVAAAFPEERPIVVAQVAFGEGGAAAGQQTVGSIFWSANHKRAVQARIDGFSVNHVGEYDDWDAISGDARRYWADYVGVARPVRVVRCAARFINRLEVPVGDDLRRHMQTRLELGESLPSLMDEYFTRVVLPFDAHRRAVITQASPPDAIGTPGKRFLLLDIDAFAETSLSPEGDDLWNEFEALRVVKNRCFFGSLQRETWEAYR